MAEIKKISTELQLLDKFLDTSGDAGGSGQVLTSTGTGINWVAPGTPGSGIYLPLTAGSTKKLTDTLYIQGTNSTGAESVLLRGVSSDDADFLCSIRTANVGGYDQEMRFYTSDANGTTNENLVLTLDEDKNAEFEGNVTTGGQVTVPSGYSVNIGTSRIHSTATSYLLGGNVGIGTTLPSTKLEVAGHVTINSPAGASQTSYGLRLRKTNSSSAVQAGGEILASPYPNNTNAANLIFKTADTAANLTQRMVIDGVGNVGIGTTTPLRGNLVVKGDFQTTGSGNAQLAIISNVSGSNPATKDIGGQMVFGGPISASDSNRTFGLVGGYKENNTSGDRAGYLTFGTRQNSGSRDIFERMRIDSVGNVGIGETVPSAKLHVLNSTKTLVLEQSASGRFNAFGFDGSNPYITYYASQGMIIGYGASTGNKPSVNTMFLGSNGNVGIGTITPALSTSGTGLHINATTSSELKFTNNTTGLGAGNGTALEMTGNNFAINNRQAGLLVFGTSNLTRMVVDSTGNVGINDTSPDFKLDINGTLGVYDLPGNATSTSALVRNETIGPELLTNGDFTGNPDLWGGSESIANGQLTKTGNGLAYQSISLTGGATYFITVDVASISGTPCIYAQGLQSGGLSAGLNELYLIAGSSNTLFGFNNGSGSVFNSVSLKLVTSASDQIQTRQLGASAFSDTEYWKADGNDIYNTNSGEVEIIGDFTAGGAQPNASLQFNSNSGNPELILKNNTATSSTVGTSTLQFKQALNSNGGKIVSTRASNYADGASRNSNLEFYTSTAATDTLKMIINSSGNVGIGSTININKLDVGGIINLQGGNGVNLTFNNGDANITVNYNNAGGVVGRNMAFKTFKAGVGNTEKMRITRDGNVGIGTESPDSKLDVTGGDITVNTSGVGFMNFKYGSVGSEATMGSIQTTGVDLKINATSDLLLLPGSNVGIGLTTPGQKLEVAGNVKVHDGYIRSEDGATGDFMQMFNDGAVSGQSFITTSSLELVLIPQNGKLQVKGENFGSGNNASLEIFNALNAAVKIKLNSNGDSYLNGGDVGIGISSPDAKLHVDGNVKIETTGVSDNLLLTSADTSASSAPDIVMYRTAAIADSDTLGVLEYRGKNGMVPSSTTPLTYSALYSRIVDASANQSMLSINTNKGNGTGAFTQAVHIAAIGTNNSATGAILINPSSDFELPAYNLDVYGTASISSTLRVVSTVTASNFILSSDKTLKGNIEEIDTKHIDVKWKNFELKSEPGIKRSGVIAQELETKHPEFVRTDKEGLKSVAYIDLLIAKIAELEARLEKAGI